MHLPFIFFFFPQKTKKIYYQNQQETATWSFAWLTGEELISPISKDGNAGNEKYNNKNIIDTDWNFTSGHAQWWSARILAEHNEEPSSLWPHCTFSLPSLAGTSAPRTICMRQILIESLKHIDIVWKKIKNRTLLSHQKMRKIQGLGK